MQENDKTKQSDSIMYASRSDALPDHLRIAIALIAGVGAVVGLHSLLSRRPDVRPDTIAVVEVEPLYKYGDKVLLLSGFYRGQSGWVIEWDEQSCEYSVILSGWVSESGIMRLQRTVQRVRLREDQLESAGPDPYPELTDGT